MKKEYSDKKTEAEKVEQTSKQKKTGIFLQFLKVLIFSFIGINIFVIAAEFHDMKSKTNWQRPLKTLEDYQQEGIKVLAETDDNQPAGQEDEADSVLGSENYKVKQITLGGEILTELENADQSRPLEISEIKNELFVPKNKEEIKLLITWKTNKSTQAVVEFAKEGESSKKKLEINNSGTKHTAVLPALAASSVYTYTITCKDRWGIEKQSDKFVFYTGAPNVSLMDVLEDAAKKTFGWAM